ncbi:serine hydrolase domain-containing protein [Nonomuraea sp. NPDC000554]|uniref:serine hydrolase domain-containing protein n=1 Tax=Nonomuraea sp. NPDC000554 TaxID=3154259 RepID=UPI00332BA756
MNFAYSLSELLHETVRPEEPGIALGVYADGKLVDHAVAGLASVEFGVPIDTRTRFDIASMSKQFTATAVLLLCRKGRLSLDDDIREHLPELKLSVPVTIGQCLRHTGGLREWLTLSALTGRPLTRITQDQALVLVAGLTDVNFAPGTAFSYSNTGYILVTSAIERITGQTLRAFTTEHLFAPLGMADTHFRDDSQEPLPRFAYGYGISDKGVHRADTEECAVGDGMVATSVADLAPWFGFLQDGRVLGEDLRDALLAHDRAYGLGLYYTTIGGQAVLGHAGGAPGYRSQLLYLPDRGVGIALLTNNSSVDPVSIGTEALRLAAGLPKDPEPVREKTVETLTGYWHDPITDETFLAEPAPGGDVTLSGGHPSGTFVRTTDGTWHHEAFRLRATPDSIVVKSIHAPGRDRTYRRCAPPAEGAMLPAAVYLSRELGILATITEQGFLELGLNLVAPIRPAPAGGFTAGLATLRPDGDDLLVSAHGVHRLRFVREPHGTRPVGIPPGLSE